MNYPNCKGCFANRTIGAGCRMLSRRITEKCPFYCKNYDEEKVETDILEYSGKGRARKDFDE